MSKKDFKNNPAMQFISQETTIPATIEIPKGKAPEGYKLNPLYIETRSKRINLLVQPSLFNSLKAEAKAKEISTNELIHSILDEHIKGDK